MLSFHFFFIHLSLQTALHKGNKQENLQNKTKLLSAEAAKR